MAGGKVRGLGANAPKLAIFGSKWPAGNEGSQRKGVELCDHRHQAPIGKVRGLGANDPKLAIFGSEWPAGNE
jgi:hypothetical protein